MHPILIDFHGFAIHTYGFFVALGVLAGIFMARHEARRVGLDDEKIVDLCFYVVIAAIVGSRLFYVATNPRFFFQHPLEIVKIWNGGLVFYGGFIAAGLLVIILLRRYRLPLGKTVDIAAVSLPLGHFFGRLGCFSAGCCYGKVCTYPWAVMFTRSDSLAPLDVPLHPTQLYSAISNLAIFFIIFSLRTKKRFDGQLFWIYVLLYGSTRSIIEYFRGDDRGGMIFHMLSISQAIGLSFAAIAAVTLIILSRRANTASHV